ncbi:MAG: acetyl-CoA carboxylase carboxyltransferase subunit beta [Vampirovibrionales bacterium]|nr:acetyl-CoA carboxylase carboxyltransferase subunit beta [Vampirovibrionales bacterium]
MSLKDWFYKRKKTAEVANSGLCADAPGQKLSDAEFGQLWAQCFQCSATLPRKEFEANQAVCPQCDYHARIGARERLSQWVGQDGDGWIEMNANLLTADPLTFTDTKPYATRITEARKSSGLNEAIITGIATTQAGFCPLPGALDTDSSSQYTPSETYALGIMDFGYMGGSMGSVVGEKITRLTEAAIALSLPLVLVSASGGARMQEGTLSLMQMVKTGSALAQLHEAGQLFISVLTEPTFGGVTASYGMLGDIILAEQGARIGFAGRRVIEQTIRQKLPADFQTADYLLRYGQVDRVVHRHNLRSELLSFLRLHRIAQGQTPKAITQQDVKPFEQPYLSRQPLGGTKKTTQSLSPARV